MSRPASPTLVDLERSGSEALEFLGPCSRVAPLGTPHGVWLEHRWFLPEQCDLSRFCTGPGRRRVDRYHDASMTPASAWKLRGTGARLELKIRAGAPHHVRVGSASGLAELWVKYRPTTDRELRGSWVEVRKLVWNETGMQITQVQAYDQRWWSVCTSAADGRFVALPKAVVSAVLAVGTPASYPAWLLMHRATRRQLVESVHD